MVTLLQCELFPSSMRNEDLHFGTSGSATAPPNFVEADVEALLNQLTDDEKISLLGAPNWWSTTKVKRLGIPSIRMSDGPNGVRGTSNFLLSPAQCIPCATSLGATFDPELIEGVGGFLAAEAKLKAASTLLAPTCNIQRNPLGGRAFESFSEDPHLSGTLAAAYVNGLQRNGVASVIKHFVCNDTEHLRTAASAEVSDRALREVYLYPFMIAQRDAKPLAYMTSYGRVNGVHVSESPALIGEQGILRKEWNFDGLVMSDWFGTYELTAPLKAGLDLEMPGPPRWRTSLLVNHSLSCQKLLLSDLDKRVRNLLIFVKRLAKLSPSTVFGEDTPQQTKDDDNVRSFNRKVASQGMVLLKNDGTLPLGPNLRVAVIGPNAKSKIISGGGSAFLKPSYVVSPFEGLVSKAPCGVSIDYAVGCYSHKYLPTLEDFMTTPRGEPGWQATFFDHDDQGHPQNPVASYVLNDTRVKLNDYATDKLTTKWTLRLHGILSLNYTGYFELGLTVCGKARLWIDGILVIDNWTNQTPGDFCYGQGTIEERAVIWTEAGEILTVEIEYSNILDTSLDPHTLDRSNPALMLVVRLGGCPAIDPDEAMQDAVDLARQCDIAVVIGGLTSEWEAEGSDRSTMDLPGRQHELIEKVTAANSKTVVVIQAGSVTSMPYSTQAAAILQAWYSGNEAGNAIADIIWGRVNPSGKLPITFPRRIEDIGPAAHNTRCERGKIHYREDIFVGYKHYQTTGIEGPKPLFAFGFGLSYTNFTLGELHISPHIVGSPALFEMELQVKITNTGSMMGSEVIQAYLALPQNIHVSHPKRQLRAFKKVLDILPGDSHIIKLHLGKYAVSYWDDEFNRWTADKGTYAIWVGTSSDDLPLQGSFTLDSSFFWTGL